MRMQGHFTIGLFKKVMKLAEALLERKAMQEKVSNLTRRLERVTIVQEGEKPFEDPEKLLAEVEDITERLEHLIFAINSTNIVATFASGKSLTAAIAERDMLKMKINVIDKVLVSCGVQNYRMQRTEIKFFPTVDVNSLQTKRDLYAKSYRELDTEIQLLNWSFDLIV